VKNFWVRFFVLAGDEPHLEYHGPYWASGYTGDGEKTIMCAAVRARDEAHVEAIIRAMFDARHAPDRIDFVHERPESWSPFSDRFQCADWMQWPEVTGRNRKAAKRNVLAAYGRDADRVAAGRKGGV
jgi:hypothetical protein